MTHILNCFVQILEHEGKLSKGQKSCGRGGTRTGDRGHGVDVEQLSSVKRLWLPEVVGLGLDDVTLDVDVDDVPELVQLTFGDHDRLLRAKQSSLRSVGCSAAVLWVNSPFFPLTDWMRPFKPEQIWVFEPRSLRLA